MIEYDRLVQDALRNVVREALAHAGGPKGLPGRHHFYITFRTHAPGVIAPDFVLQKYPDEMTIVIEHQFWELKVEAQAFQVVLKFGGVPHLLRVPYAAITRFNDPSVRFMLQFEPHADDAIAHRPGTRPTIVHPDSLPDAEPTEAPAPESGASVISLDRFRRKPTE
ncbi:MAG TPA: stringent starvation protein B [Hyphomonadaceae bacterium]|jgi:Uncharacterized protein conserved in bacteria|nr:stringent starvation protein B [Hyphomonadaceae bacterium]